MRKVKANYTAEFKTKVVLELLKEEQTINEISSKYNVSTKNLYNWKSIFLSNAVLAIEPSKAVSSYKDEIKDLNQKVSDYAKKVGELTLEKDWAVGKLKSLDLSTRKSMVGSKLEQNISMDKQCKMLDVNRQGLYYNPVVNTVKETIKTRIVELHSEIPFYGYIKVQKQLEEEGYSVCENTVQKYRKELGLRAILAVRDPINASLANKEHKKYSYKLRGLDIVRANQVWSTDITYVKTKAGFVYFAAIIDWYSKAVLSWKVSNCMDSSFVMSVLNEALDLYGDPEIFNTDQGSQYTSNIHTQTLIDRGITVSMDGKGRAIDNICIERFWRSAKCEKIYLNQYNGICDLRDDVRDYIEFYNYKRFHETLNYQKPMDVYHNSINNNKNVA